jgi:hypothetical protein
MNSLLHLKKVFPVGTLCALQSSYLSRFVTVGFSGASSGFEEAWFQPYAVTEVTANEYFRRRQRL